MSGDTENFPTGKPGTGPVSLDGLMAPAGQPLRPEASGPGSCHPHGCAPPAGPDSDAPC